MNRITFVLVVAMAAAAACGEGTGDNSPANRSAEARKAGIARRYALSGGHVERPGEGKAIRIVNAQEKVPLSAIDVAVDSIKYVLRFSVIVAVGETGKRYFPTEENPVVITIADEPNDTTLLVAPEQSWGVVNVGALTKDSPAAEVLAARVRKEIWRALAMVLGASNSMSQPCVMRQINSLEDLDKTPTLEPSPEPFNFMIAASAKLGIARVRRTSYKRACEEGWAPAPTNEVQKAIWERVRADKERGPSNPMRINPPRK